MSKFRIPKQFKLFGHTFIVEYDELYNRVEGDMGEYSPQEHKIFLKPIMETNKQEKEALEETFIHELLRICLLTMRKDISKDETFVSVLAGFLHQAITTAEYDEVENAST